jgi:hypothetical protein
MKQISFGELERVLESLGEVSILRGAAKLRSIFGDDGSIPAAHRTAKKYAHVVIPNDSEESLRVRNKRPRGILRAKSALRMTLFLFCANG